jgi:hypothetical protein
MHEPDNSDSGDVIVTGGVEEEAHSKKQVPAMQRFGYTGVSAGWELTTASVTRQESIF